jgi:hypothetical protein
MANQHNEDDVTDDSDTGEWQCQEVAVFLRPHWLRLLTELPAEVAAELRALSWGDEYLAIVPKVVGLLIIAILDSRASRH